jgi:NAD(P)-dependent dehydrogenase (short-subunit alcohol dehydrogenase family)
LNTRELFELDGRVAIVTGGGRGIGRQIATALAEMGSDVVVCGRNLESCEETAADLATRGVKAFGMRCDVRSGDEIAEVVARTKSELGRVDVLVNNAGTVWAGWPEDGAIEGWQKVVDVNLTGLFLFCRAAGRLMIEQQSGRIINIASIAAFRGAPPEIMNTISYQATKGAVVALTRDLACKWARHNINVNAIAPGWFVTGMTEMLLAQHEAALIERIPLRRLGGSDDLKGVAVFLASPASSWVTGQTYVVDGGESAW